MSDIFREALMEDAARINVSQMTWAQVKQGHKRAFRKINWKRRLFIYAASAALLAIVAIGVSGFVSPVMAKALQNIPVIGKLYSFTYLPELNRYASDANPSAADKGITVSVPKAYYDGKQLDLIYAIQVPQGYKPITDYPQISIPYNEVQLNGKPLSFGSALGGDSLISTNMYRGDVDWNLSYEQAPQNGILTIPILQVGTIQGNWTLSVPVSSVAIDKVTKSEFPHNASSTYDGITLIVNKVSKGPVYTTISMQVIQPLQANGKPKHKMDFASMLFLVLTPDHQCIGFGEYISNQIAKKINNKEVWDVTIKCNTPSNNIKSIIVEPVFNKIGTTGNSPNISQLDVVVPIN